MLSPNDKGAIAELGVTMAAIRCGVAVYKPVSEHLVPT
jgi:hypothetical protein